VEKSKSDLPYWCGRCGWHKVAEKGHTCDGCKRRDAQNAAMWACLKCWKCGKPAMGFNINGAFCRDEDHYPRQGQGDFHRIEGEGIVGMIVPIRDKSDAD
jgi:hypothetical protein